MGRHQKIVIPDQEGVYEIGPLKISLDTKARQERACYELIFEISKEQLEDTHEIEITLSCEAEKTTLYQAREFGIDTANPLKVIAEKPERYLTQESPSRGGGPTAS